MKALKHELKFKSASSNPRVTSSNPQLTSSNSRVTSSNPRVTSSNPQITSSDPRAVSSNPRIIKSNTNFERRNLNSPQKSYPLHPRWFWRNFHLKLKTKKWRYQFCVIKKFYINICVRISFKKIEYLFFFGDSNIEENIIILSHRIK